MDSNFVYKNALIFTDEVAGLLEDELFNQDTLYSKPLKIKKAFSLYGDDSRKEGVAWHTLFQQ